MFGGDIKIGRLAGIPISIHPLWLVIVALITWSLGSTYYPDEVSGIAPAAAYGLGLASALLLFASILLHELGHAIVARRYGVEIEGIELWLLGGVAKMKGVAHRPGEELRFALAGPGVTVVIALTFLLALALLPSSTPDAVTALFAYQALINGMILVFNMLPAFPLDGGRVLRSLLWRREGDFERATARAARVGRVFGYGMVGLGVLGVFAGVPGFLWLALIGFFLIVAGRAEEAGAELQSTFKESGLRRVMAMPASTLDAGETVARALRDSFAAHGYRSFPVTEGGRAVGLLTIDRVEKVPPAHREDTLVGEIADRDPSVFVDEDVTVDELLASPGFARHKRAVVRREDGQIGIISASAIERAVRARRMLDNGQPLSTTPKKASVA